MMAFFLSACDKGNSSGNTAHESPNIQIVHAKGNLDSPHLKPDTPPNSQQNFELLRTGKLSAYDSAINEIQKSAVFNKANDDLVRMISAQGQHLLNWVGKVDSLTTSHAGKEAYVKIKSSNGAIYRMKEDAIAGSKIYQQISSLHEGQLVKFSGILNNNDSSPEKWETSLTERGSLESPEFSVNFESIEPYINDGKVFPSMAIVAENPIPLTPLAFTAELPEEVKALELVALVLTRVPTTPKGKEISLYTGAKGHCRGLKAVLASSVRGREHGMPLAESQRHIEEILVNAGATENDKELWNKAVSSIYASTVTSEQIWNFFDKQCEEIPDGR